MKKYLYVLAVLFIFCLNGCSNETPNDSETIEVKEKIEITDEKSKPEESPKYTDNADWREQYNDVLIDLLNTFGPAYNGSVFYSMMEWRTGGVYAELVDFDQDGNDELYVLFESEDYYNLPLEHRNVSSYIHEVWQATNSGEVKLLHYGEIPKDNCLDCGVGFSFLEQTDGRIILHEAMEQYNIDETDGALFTDSYFKLEDGIFKKEILAYYTGNYEYTKVNGKEVSEATYRMTATKYELPQRSIVENEYGIYDFHFDFESSAAYLGQFIKDLNEGHNSLASNGQKAEEAILDVIEGEAPNYIEIDVKNPSRYTRMLSHLFENYYLDMESGESSFDDFLGYLESTVAEKFESVYGTMLNMELIDYKGEDNELADHRVRYESGEFSYMPVDDIDATVMRQIESAYEIAQDTYYLELLDVEFEEWEFYHSHEGFQKLVMDYVLKPFEEWPHEMRNYGKTEIHRYAVVRVVDGQVIYRYLSYAPLSDYEMKQY